MYFTSFDALTTCPGYLVVPGGSTQMALNAAFDHAAAQGTAASWEPPALLGLSAAIRQAFSSGSVGGARADDVAFMLSADQERALWEQVISADRAFAGGATEQAERLAADAWQRLHWWHLSGADDLPYVSADVAAFRRWARAYRERTAALGVTDEARVLAGLAGARQLTPGLLAHGFIDVPPVLRTWLTHNGQAFDQRDRGEITDYTGHAFADRSAELRHALVWAAQLAQDNPHARIAVVLDTLGRDHELVARCCDEVFGDRRHGGGTDYFLGHRGSAPHSPLLALALAILTLQPVPRWDALSALIRHPLLAGAETEGASRAVFDASLRELERYELPLPFVVNRLAEAATCPQLAGLLTSLSQCFASAPRRQPMAAWLAHFDECLTIADWPGERRADPSLNVWSSACDRLNALDAVMAPVSRGEALARLRRFVLETVPAAPAPRRGIFIVAPDTALALDPTHVWFAGCESDLLLNEARLSPLLPLDQQRDAGLPGADPRVDLWRARVIIETLAARTVAPQASFATSDGEITFSPSPLLPALWRTTAKTTRDDSAFVPCNWRQPAAEVEEHEDLAGPALAPGSSLPGGVSVLAAQAACPFRAYARFRLAASAVIEPAPGISARHKGTFVHRILARIWARVDDLTALQSLDRTARTALIREAIGAELKPLPFETAVERELFFIERDRLTGLLEKWLEFESGRAPFTVLAREFKVSATLGELNFSTRLDRADRMADGSVVIVDYKTGAASPRDWDPPRMNEPQLPYYALTAPFDDVAAIAFARVDSARPAWQEAPRPGEASADEWSERRAQWAQDLARLAAGIAAGDATPDPKRGAETCRFCEQVPFCRRVEIALQDDGDTNPEDGDSGDE